MMKNREKIKIQNINNTMCLRLPQFYSLEILDKLMRELDLSNDLDILQNQINAKYPIFKEFERSFPSITFALATGVGKTILMGAFITYLYLNYDIKNFFIVAPNLTVYNKLIKDFGRPNYSKYVFKRITAFTQNLPTVVTGDNYDEYVAEQTQLQDSITIHIFNIGKINAEVRGNSVPHVKRLAEYIGTSYFDYLSKLSDLVLLMDESHHYRADRGMKVINELFPLLGLELTATPQTESSKGPVKFKNVVYEYSLAKAISDGFVKEPAAATRKSFNLNDYTIDEIDEIKLKDGIRIHQNTKAELLAYAENEKCRLVKPFVLVVCKDTSHASNIKTYISSSDFYDGYYCDKVIELHSNQRGSEKDENIQKLVSLEDENNKIEIVIHVNMLKEGWDVTNLYTIIPLRTAVSLTLREQTIGRGLRLPYGKRTGNIDVDRLTIVAHDKFEEIIAAANDEKSIINLENLILIEDDDDLGKEKEVFKPKTIFDDFIEQQEKKISYARSDEKKKALKDEIETAKAVSLAIDEILTNPVNISMPYIEKQSEQNKNKDSTKQQTEIIKKVITSNDLNCPEIKNLIKEKAKQNLENYEQTFVDLNDLDAKIEIAISPVIEQKIRHSIDIPDIVLVSKGTQKNICKEFDLRTEHWTNFSIPNDEILLENLKNGDTYTILNESILSLSDSLENIILGEILNASSLLSYDENADLLYKLIGQAINFIGASKNINQLNTIIAQNKKTIAKLILDQINFNTELSPPLFDVMLIKAVSPILMQDYTKFKEDEVLKYTTTIPAYEIKKKVVGHFKKACHTAYKFDSVPEHIFSVVLERSSNVLKWLRPAKGQFKIHWSCSHLYVPDFIVETNDNIFIVEVKAYNKLDDEEVKLKARVATTYCNNVNTMFFGTGKKTWSYILISDHFINRSNTFNELIDKAEYQK